MVGIRPANESEKWSDEACREIYEIVSHCEQLFVLSTGIRSVTDDTVKCNAYDVIYLEPWTRRNINQLVESKGIAALDPESKHLIDFIVDWNLLTNSSATDAYDTDSWDSDDVNEDIYDAGTYLSKNLEFINQDSDGSDKEFDIQFDDDQIRELVSYFYISGQKLFICGVHRTHVMFLHFVSFSDVPDVGCASGLKRSYRRQSAGIGSVKHNFSRYFRCKD